MKNKNELKIEEQYKKMNQHEHILALPDTYIGSIQEDQTKMWVYNSQNNCMDNKMVNYIPGLYKIFDEILVNARDHSVKDNTCDTIKVTIDEKKNEISCYNNGNNGIDVVIHPDYKVYIPEFLFANLLTSTHYKQEKKTVGGKNGYGSKCVQKETTLPLWDGEVKKACDLTTNDKLIGEDGTVRNIKSIINGKGKMYKITQMNGEPYEVNDQHTLTLHMPDHKVIFWNATENGWSVLWWDHEKKSIKKKTIKISHTKNLCEECNIEFGSHLGRHYRRQHPELPLPAKERKKPTVNAPDTEEVRKARKELEEFCEKLSDCSIFDIDIEDYMKLNETTKLRLAGVRADCVQWPKKEVKFDPYLLGLWLGDGYSSGYAMAINDPKDPEILDYLTKWCNNNDADIKKTRPFTFSITSRSKKGKNNSSPLGMQLKHYNLKNNKHIPMDYIVNDRDTRLKVLAGLIDTDGCTQREGTRIIITQGLKHKKLIDDIVLLSRSLGFYCSLSKKNTSWTHKGVKKTGEAYNLNISGNIEDIPTLLPRKKCANITRRSNKTTGQIQIKDIGEGDYVGIEVDGNQRFVINDFTVTHNCTNIFSKNFYIEVVDGKRKLKYCQNFYDNMYRKDEPVITNTTGKSYTLIKFTPDFKKFNVEGLNDDMISIFKKRVYDLAACTTGKVKVYLNDKLININKFNDYIKMFYGENELTHEPIYEEANERWKVGVVYDPNSGFRQLSYVNGICTFQGGMHVTHVTDQVINGIIDHIKIKNKDLKIKNATIKENLTFFIDSIIEDPSFSSQTKEFLTTKVSLFGSKCDISEKFIKELSKTGLIEEVVNFAKLKEMQELKKIDGKKTTSVKGLPKLYDADWAGTRKSKDARLILTEGDSAMDMALEGRTVIGAEQYGVFPLRGKLLNIRDVKPQKVMKNEEIKNIIQIMGLKMGKKYTDVSQLRYGGIICLTDQDMDGSHIKGLLMNLIHFYWPSLLKIDGFIQSMATPILKAWKRSDTKKKDPLTFYTMTDYENWTKNQSNMHNWHIKYYKGLGTSDDKEARECFQDFNKKIITYVWDTDKPKTEKAEKVDQLNDSDTKSNDTESIDEDTESEKNHECYNALTLAFSKHRANDRKRWLANYDQSVSLDAKVQKVPYSEFVNKDLIHFSNYDNIRSIPSVCDGLKPSQRKIIYTAFLEKLLKTEVKVVQLAGSVMKYSAYHHGDASLYSTTISLAQNFPCSNNINILQPNGQFGNRRDGGKHHASPRYIFTQLNPLTPYIFKKEDEYVYKYNDDDGTKIEPVVYAPIIPMVLCNGIKGIGTGYSTDIANYNPKDLIKNIRNLLKSMELEDMSPWFKGFTGKIVKADDNTFYTYGIVEIIDQFRVIVKELPRGTWTDDYFEELDKMVVDDKNPKKGQIIKSYDKNCGTNTIKITITFMDGVLQRLIKNGSLEKELKLITSIRLTNMHLYDSNAKLRKYLTVHDIIKEYYDFRLRVYGERKKYLLRLLENEIDIMKWKIKFLEFVISGKIILIGTKNIPVKKTEVIKTLEQLNFPRLSTNVDAVDSDKTYNYIIQLSIFSVTEEDLEKLRKEYDEEYGKYKTYKNTSVEEIWLSELDELERVYDKWIEEQSIDEDNQAKSKAKGKKTIKSNNLAKPKTKKK